MSLFIHLCKIRVQKQFSELLSCLNWHLFFSKENPILSCILSDESVFSCVIHMAVHQPPKSVKLSKKLLKITFFVATQI